MDIVPFYPLTPEHWAGFRGSTRGYLLDWQRTLDERLRIGAPIDDLDVEFDESKFDVGNVMRDEEIPMARPDEVPDGYVLLNMKRGVPEGNLRIKVLGYHADTVKRLRAGLPKKNIPPMPHVGLGNAASGEVEAYGAGCPDFVQAGREMIYYCNGLTNRAGHTIRVAGFDANGIMETTYHRILVPWHVLLEAPGGEFDAEMALRLPTAAHQFEMAWGSLGVKEQLGSDTFPDPKHTYRVLVGSGGVSLLFAQYAKLRLTEMGVDHEVWCVSGSPEEHALLTELGIKCVNRRDDEWKWTSADEAAGKCKAEAVGKFAPTKLIAYFRGVTEGEMFDIISENVGGPDWVELTEGLLGSMGQLCISGWLLGRLMEINRALNTLGHHSIHFPHYCPRKLGEKLAPYFRKIRILTQPTVIEWAGIPESLNRFVRNQVQGLEMWNLAA